MAQIGPYVIVHQCGSLVSRTGSAKRSKSRRALRSRAELERTLGRVGRFGLKMLIDLCGSLSTDDPHFPSVSEAGKARKQRYVPAEKPSSISIVEPCTARASSPNRYSARLAMSQGSE